MYTSYLHQYLSLIKTRFTNPSASEISYQFIIINALVFLVLLRFGLAFDIFRPNRTSSDIKPASTFGDACASVFSKRIFLGKGFLTDVGLYLLTLIPMAFLLPFFTSSGAFMETIPPKFARFFEPIPAGTLVPQIVFSLLTYLAFEVTYYFFHMIFHRVPVLWQFHKVHHSATTLSFMTDNRFHPVEKSLVVFLYIYSMKVASVLVVILFGSAAKPLLIFGVAPAQIILGLSLAQHSNLWLSYRWMDRLWVSPAMHQMHHATKKDYYNCNYALSLGLLDYVFGTFRQSERVPPQDFEIGLGDVEDNCRLWEKAGPIRLFFKPFFASYQLILGRNLNFADKSKTKNEVSRAA